MVYYTAVRSNKLHIDGATQIRVEWKKEELSIYSLVPFM